jgi:hypothetical protein
MRGQCDLGDSVTCVVELCLLIQKIFVSRISNG